MPSVNINTCCSQDEGYPNPRIGAGDSTRDGNSQESARQDCVVATD